MTCTSPLLKNSPPLGCVMTGSDTPIAAIGRAISPKTNNMAVTHHMFLFIFTSPLNIQVHIRNLCYLQECLLICRYIRHKKYQIICFRPVLLYHWDGNGPYHTPNEKQSPLNSAGIVYTYFISNVMPTTTKSKAQAKRKITAPFSPNLFLIT